MRCFMIIYNTLLVLSFLMGSPALALLVIATPKWRGIVRQRLAYWNYPWEKTRRARNLRTLWIHALSVGEVTAAQPLILDLRTDERFNRIVVSCTTFTGFHTACRLFEGCDICYFPFDWIGSVRRMADKIDPRQVIIIETDLWPNFLREMRRRKVPVFLANVRLSDKTYAAYRRFRPAVGVLYGALHKIGVQAERDRKRFMQLGIPAERLAVTGNIKFDAPDQTLDGSGVAQWRDCMRIAPGDRVLVAGSTHAGEERMVIAAIRQLKSSGARCRLLIAPRDPLRAGEVALLARHNGFSVQPLSTLESKPEWSEVVVIDRMGLLRFLYGLADIAFVGGSLVMRGGHNPLEPAAWGKAILFGPDMRDFVDIAERMLESGAAKQVEDAQSLAGILNMLLAEPAVAQAMGRSALAVFKTHKGAVRRTLAFFGRQTKEPEMDSTCR